MFGLPLEVAKLEVGPPPPAPPAAPGPPPGLFLNANGLTTTGDSFLFFTYFAGGSFAILLKYALSSVILTFLRLS